MCRRWVERSVHLMFGEVLVILGRLILVLVVRLRLQVSS